jgi:AcrR family transcriptional regulator
MPPFANGSADRRAQILSAAMVCFAKCGFHQTSMHDISDQAGISVGLIYRYFENKDAVISAMVDDHKRVTQELLNRAHEAPSLLEALEIFFTAHCCANQRQIQSAFVVDLFAEGSRNPRVGRLVRDVVQTLIEGVAELIAHSPETRRCRNGMKPREMAELLFAALRGMLMRDVVDPSNVSDAQRRERQLKVLRRMWRLLFDTKPQTTTRSTHAY